MNDKYCQLMDGECERKTIRNYCKPFNDQPDEFIANYEQCPWPSRQVPVKSSLKDIRGIAPGCTGNLSSEDFVRKIRDDAFAAGRLDGLREAREAVEKKATEIRNAPFTKNGVFYPKAITVRDILAAIDGLIEK